MSIWQNMYIMPNHVINNNKRRLLLVVRWSSFVFIMLLKTQEMKMKVVLEKKVWRNSVRVQNRLLRIAAVRTTAKI